jgi:ATP-dependent Clp protease ATP-binding subunit ClpC
MSDEWMARLTYGAQQLVQAARRARDQAGHRTLGVNHWLWALVETYSAMLARLAVDLDPRAAQTKLQAALARGETGNPLDESTLVEQAWQHAQARGKAQAYEADLAGVVLSTAGYRLAEETPGTSHPGASNSAPTLERLGRNLTELARQGKLSPVIGRADETQLVVETLCRRTKRNPLLVGPAGVGKTAIVEGLAQRVIQERVPAPLIGATIVELQPWSLMTGAASAGEFRQRVEEVVREASQPGILLFIDELHALMRSVADVLKPALARGELACIAATTDDEYRLIIEADRALERRFQPIRVQEMSPEDTLLILKALATGLTDGDPIHVSDAALIWLVDFAGQFMRNRYFPDKGVDLLEQCVAYAVSQGKIQLEPADVQAVAQRMVGMPLDVTTRLSRLQARLGELGLLSPEEIESLLTRLGVTLRSADLRPFRPNAVVWLAGAAARAADRLAAAIAECLFGTARRVVRVDLSTFFDEHLISNLTGAPPGYIGYSEATPLHQLAQIPWCVVHFESIDECHPAIRQVIAQAMAIGRLVDGRGQPLYFSDTVVLLTASAEHEIKRNPLGFRRADELEPSSGAAGLADGLHALAEDILQPALARQVDVVLTGAGTDQSLAPAWLRQHLLTDLVSHYRKQGILVSWDDSLVAWLSCHPDYYRSQLVWEEWVDGSLTPVILQHLPAGPTAQPVQVTIRLENGRVIAS